jgi:septal ring factor EnvC (AmiA/AmiB activator)
MMRKKRAQIEVFSLSFLDVICCGFGAIILLFVIALGFEPSNVQKMAVDLRDDIEARIDARQTISEQSQSMMQELAAKRQNLAELSAQLTALQGNLTSIQARSGSVQAREQAQIQAERRLKEVRQSLSAEMERLLSQPDYKPPSDKAVIGGVPVDSEYIIFIIDTS